MNRQPDPPPSKTLRDAYRVRGFRVLAKLDAYELEPPVVVLTLNRRAKKPCAAAAGEFAEASMTNAGGGRGIWVAGIVKFISISRCAGSHAKRAA
jgi:hypothetical protein